MKYRVGQIWSYVIPRHDLTGKIIKIDNLITIQWSDGIRGDYTFSDADNMCYKLIKNSINYYQYEV